MKPDWKDAPEWANWTAMDDDGDWYWYEKAPVAGAGFWYKGGRAEFAFTCANGWRTAIYGRPTTTDPDARPGSEGQGA